MREYTRFARNMRIYNIDERTQVLVSYLTPVAVITTDTVIGSGGICLIRKVMYQTDIKYSPTTSRHISKWCYAEKPKTMKIVPQEQIDSMAGQKSFPVVTRPKKEVE